MAKSRVLIFLSHSGCQPSPWGLQELPEAPPSHPPWPLALSAYLAHPSMDPLLRTKACCVVQDNPDLQDTRGTLRGIRRDSFLRGSDSEPPLLRCLWRTGAPLVTVLQASGAQMRKPGLLRVTAWWGGGWAAGPRLAAQDASAAGACRKPAREHRIPGVEGTLLLQHRTAGTEGLGGIGFQLCRTGHRSDLVGAGPDLFSTWPLFR